MCVCVHICIGNAPRSEGPISHGKTLHFTATHRNKHLCITSLLRLHATHCNTLQHTTTQCNTLQHIATHCMILQHTATHCHTPPHTAVYDLSPASPRNTAQHSATYCQRSGISIPIQSEVLLEESLVLKNTNEFKESSEYHKLKEWCLRVANSTSPLTISMSSRNLTNSHEISQILTNSHEISPRQ